MIVQHLKTDEKTIEVLDYELFVQLIMIENRRQWRAGRRTFFRKMESYI
jgi:hypothetical protein